MISPPGITMCAIGAALQVACTENDEPTPSRVLVSNPNLFNK
jgi:hypothetical protein